MNRRALFGAALSTASGAALAMATSVTLAPIATAAATPDNPFGPFPPHQIEAEQLIDYLNLLPWGQDYNRYKIEPVNGEPEEPTVVTWGSPGNPASFRNISQCASFITQTLMHTYPWATTDYFRRYFNSTSPFAERYYEIFESGRAPHFQKITKVTELQPGDLIAMDHRNSSTTYTGHMAMVRTVKGIYTAKKPLVGSVQYAIEIIDCTKYAHGSYGVNDYASYPDSRITPTVEYTGAGYGHMMFYGDQSRGEFTGLRWSVNSTEIHPISSRKIVAARVA